ncbi:hypothetical protein QJS10_CPB17g01333 [Acorus calamus]|uniref:Uncharacterized protein n=1 Tax=Acorus calamus TaxID=4465 RepID=A0AAV9CXS4_ACOCL|nr:hypothetical protein QJS10_CPB17g01333 [Acorus calamus]
MIEIFITVEHNVSFSVLPTPEDREAHIMSRYDSSDEGYDDEYFGEGVPQSFSIFCSDADDEMGEQMHKFSVVFEDEEDDEPNIRKGRAGNVTIEEIDVEEQIEPVHPSQRDSQRRAPGRPRKENNGGAGRSVRGMPTAERGASTGGTARGYFDGDPINRAPGRGYGSGMFSYRTSDHARGYTGLRGMRPPRSS